MHFHVDIVLVARRAAQRNGKKRHGRFVLVGHVEHHVVGRGLGGCQAKIEAEAVLFNRNLEDVANPFAVAAHGAGLAIFGHAEHVERGRVIGVGIALFDALERPEGGPLAVVLRLIVGGLAFERAAGRRGASGTRVAGVGTTEGARPTVKAKRSGGVGRALQVVVFFAAVGVKYADVDRDTLLFGDEEEGLGEIVVAPLLVRLHPEGY